MHAVVTAGGRISGPLAEQTGQSIKGLIEFGGSRLIDRVLGALHEAEAVDRVCVVGPPEIRDTLDLRADDLWRDEAETAADNLLAGLEATRGEGRVVCCTCDLPFIEAAAIDDLAARAPEAGVVYPVFTREEVRARFPHEANSYVPLRDGDMTGSSAMVFDPAAVLDRRDEIDALFRARKDFLKLAGLMGYGFFIQLALTYKLRWRLLSVAALVRRFSRLAGFPVAVLRGCSPTLSLDIDHERDLAEALAHLETGS